MSATSQRSFRSTLWPGPVQTAVAGVALVLLLGQWFGWGRLATSHSPPLTSPPVYRVDVNRANWPELAQLPGIGETRARQIVESRENEGPFRNANDLQRIKGIGPKTVERIARYVTVRESHDEAKVR